MKNVIKFILFFVIVALISLMIPNSTFAATTVHDEESLNSAISSADSGATITLQNDITVTKPIVIAKELTIDGNGHNIVGSNEWTSTSGNQTMFTAQFSAAKLTLKNIKLKNGPKYGVQSYDGATVILDNVSISGFKYGGVLANGGNVEIRKLHLGKNGTNENNGIEIDKGASATNNPTLTMNGTLTTESNQNVIRPAENGHLTDFTITNSPNTTNKVVLAGNKVVLTDSANNIISETTIPDKATPNVDTQKLIVTIVTSNDVTYKITVNSGEQISADLLKSHIKLEENYKVDGFYSDSNYNTAFDFNNYITTDTTVYAKISKVETASPEATPETDSNKKDETPKTGVENYLGVAVLTILFSLTTIGAIKNKNNKG